LFIAATENRFSEPYSFEEPTWMTQSKVVMRHRDFASTEKDHSEKHHGEKHHGEIRATQRRPERP